MPPIRSLLMTAQLKTEQFEAGAKKVQSSLRDIGSTTHMIQGSISGLGTSLLQAGTAAGAAMLSFHGLKAGIEGLLAAGDKSRALTISFTAITGSAEKARKEMDFVSAASNRLGVNTIALADGYKVLVAASKGTTLEGEKTREIFSALTDASRVMGLSQEKLQGALLAVGQMMSKGKISAEELSQQLAERIPGSTQIMARALGVTTAELFKMMQAGELLAEDALPKWAAQMKRELGQGTEAAALTAGQAFAKLGNVMTDMVKGPGQELSEWIGRLVGGLADVALEAIKARDRLDALAKQRTTADVLRVTGGNYADTPENKARIDRLGKIERDIAAAEEMLAQNKSRLAASTNFLTKRFYQDLVNIEERRLIDLRKQQAAVEKTITRGNQPNPMEGAGTADIGPNAFDAKQEAEVERQKRLVEALEAVAKEAQKIYDITLATGGAFEAATARAKFLDDELKKIAKTAPDITKALSGGSGKYAAPAAIGERIRFHAAQQGVDPVLMEALTSYESGFNPKATSKAGAKGLMQIMPENYPSLGITDPYDVEQNLRGGMKLFRQLLDAFQGDVAKALTAYHSGPSKAKSGDLGPEGLKYAPSVLAREASLKGTGAAPNTPAQAKFAELLAWQKDAERVGLEHKATTKRNTDMAKAEADADKAVADAIEGRAGAMETLLRSLKDGRKELSEYETADIRAQLTQVQGFDASKAMIGNLLTEIDVRREVTAALKTEAVEQERLGEIRKKSAEAYAKELKQEQDAYEAYAKQKLAWQAEISSNAIAANEEIAASQKELGSITMSIFDAMGEALKGGEDAWIQFAETVTRMLLKVAMEQSNFEGKLGEWLQKGVGAAISIFGAASGASSVDLQAGDVGGSVDFASVGMAAGGPVSAGKAYLVGESGKELFIPQTSGTIVNNALTNAYTHGATMMANAHTTANSTSQSSSSSVVQGDRPISVTVNVQGATDAQSFQRSKAEIQRSLVQAMQAAQRST